jgi:hypothetical protein
MIRQILEDCQKGLAGVGFNEVVLMLSNTVTTAEVYTMLDDLRFTEKGDIVTFMADGGTHLHMQLNDVKEVRLNYTERNERGEPSYSVWFIDQNQEPALRIYLRKSEQQETNQPRHQLFMSLMEKYGETISVGG